MRVLTAIPTWINDYTHHQMWNEMTYLFPTFNGATVHSTHYWACGCLHMPGLNTSISVKSGRHIAALHEWTVSPLVYWSIRERPISFNAWMSVADFLYLVILCDHQTNILVNIILATGAHLSSNSKSNRARHLTGAVHYVRYNFRLHFH